MFSDLNYTFSLDKENPMSHKYFIRKIKTREFVLQIRCQGFRKKKLPWRSWISERKPMKKFRVN